jgi:hypothetical protein
MGTQLTLRSTGREAIGEHSADLAEKIEAILPAAFPGGILCALVAQDIVSSSLESFRIDVDPIILEPVRTAIMGAS